MWDWRFPVFDNASCDDLPYSLISASCFSIVISGTAERSNFGCHERVNGNDGTSSFGILYLCMIKSLEG